jgi:transcriptional regulator with XRE-family HTH domain
LKRSSPPVSPGTRYKRRKKLVEFGEFVKSAREAKIPSQQKAVEVFARHGLEISQSWAAQLETGRLTDPDPEILRKIEAAYGVDYDRLVYALVRDKYRLDDHAVASPLTRQRWQILAALLGTV